MKTKTLEPLDYFQLKARLLELSMQIQTAEFARVRLLVALNFPADGLVTLDDLAHTITVGG